MGSIITASNLTSGTTSGGSGSSTSSITPSANALILITVFSVVGSGTPNIPSISGNGLSWSQVATNASQTPRRITLFAAMGGNPSSGAIAISFGGQTQNNYSWIVDQITNPFNTALSASAAIVQSSTNSHDNSASTGLTMTLGAFSNSLNSTYGVVGADTNAALSAGSNFTQLAQATLTPTMCSEFASSNQTSVNFTWSSGTFPSEGIAVEIKSKNIFPGSMI